VTVILDVRRCGRSSASSRRRLSYWVPELMASKNRSARRTPLMAICKKCGLAKPHKKRSDASTPHSSCLDCQKAEMKRWREEHWAEEKLRNTLRGMINRCHRPDRMKRWASAAGIAGAWRDYGAAGVKVCDGLRAGKAGLALFREVVGLPPTKAHTLDRIDPCGSYVCGRCDSCKAEGATANVRWADKATQDANRKNARPLPGFDPDTGDFVELTINEWGRRLGIPAVTLRKRMKAGWPIERVLCRDPDERDEELPDLDLDEARELEADEPEEVVEQDGQAPF
jgi:hypothetical protein